MTTAPAPAVKQNTQLARVVRDIADELRSTTPAHAYRILNPIIRKGSTIAARQAEQTLAGLRRLRARKTARSRMAKTSRARNRGR